MSKAPRKRELASAGDPNHYEPPPFKRNREQGPKYRDRKLYEVLSELTHRVRMNDRQLTIKLIRELDTEHVRVVDDADFEKSCRKMLKACMAAKVNSISTKLMACLMSMFQRGSPQRKRQFLLSLQENCEGLAKSIDEAEKYQQSIRGASTSRARIADTDGSDTEYEDRLGADDEDSDAAWEHTGETDSEDEKGGEKMEHEDITVVDAFFKKTNLDYGILGMYVSSLREEVITADDVPEKVKLIARRAFGEMSLSKTMNRIAAIEFYVALAISTHQIQPPYDTWLKHMQDCEQHLTVLKDDRDFRVRKAVAEGLLELNQVFKLSNHIYFTAKRFLRDTDSDVRIAAIRIMIQFANNAGSEIIYKEGKDPRATTSISDDAFSAICDAMNDIEIAVRVEAAQTLGDFLKVSEDLIYQTLDKKMMRSTTNRQVVKVDQSLFALSKKANTQKDRRWKFAKKAPKQVETRGGWSRGKELHAAAPGEEEKKKVQEEDEAESIIPHGACGAFVSALEDEFMDVRKAAVYSLGRLACTRPAFAVSALEYLADMFNDEIADVRLDAIRALTPLIAHGQLNSEQLNVISKCLDDAMPESRQAMRDLLKRAQFVDVNCVEMCVKALLACLKRFPKDKEQIYGCMADIGNNHSVQVQSIMRSLLDIQLVFHTREPSIDDPEYVGRLIMVLNAAASQPSLVMFMPEFVHRHYRYLRNAYPNIVRAIKVIDEEKQIGRIKKSDDVTDDKAEDVVLNTYQRLCEVSGYTSILNMAEKNSQRDDVFRDATAISLYNASVSGAARLVHCLGEVSANVDSVINTVLRGGELTNVKQLIAQSVEDMQSIEHRFSGISMQIHSYLIYCRVYLSFLDLLIWLMQVIAPQQDVIAAGRSICLDAKTSIGEHEAISESLATFLNECEAIFNPPIEAQVVDDKKKIITSGTLVNLLEKFQPLLPKKFPPVKAIHVKYAKITSPNKDTAIEETLKFFAHLPHGMPLEFEVHNMREDELEMIRVKTVYPDGRHEVTRPRAEEIREEKRYFTVSTQLKITCSAPWSEAAEIDVIIGIWSGGKFVPVFASPSSFTPAHIRVRIHPHSR